MTKQNLEINKQTNKDKGKQLETSTWKTKTSTWKFPLLEV